MTQLAITKAATPSQLILRIIDDPHNPAADLMVSAIVYAADGSVLVAHPTTLKGVERDFLDTLVQVAVEAWQWGAPAQNLAPALRRVKKEARAHREKHEAR